MIAQSRRAGFTLAEVLISIGILGLLATIVVLAVNPKKRLVTAQNAKRAFYSKNLENAVNQYVIDKGALPINPQAGIDPPATAGIDRANISTDPAQPTPICKANATDKTNCVDKTPLVTNNYLPILPIDLLHEDSVQRTSPVGE